MLLAAGKGSRMREISKTTPKPLVEIAGKSLLGRILDQLEQAKVEEVVVNVHHLADQIEDFLATSQHGFDIIISDEREELLETGGGVLSALEVFGADPFYVINSDALWIDQEPPLLNALAQNYQPETMDGLLTIISKDLALGFDGAGDFFQDREGRLTWRGNAEEAPWVFGGIQILHPRLFEGEELGVWSLKRLYDRAAEANRLFGNVTTANWMHVGTPEAIDLAEREIAILTKGGS